LNSGAAIVGNVGTARRFNFTAVGEPVNLAARLEAVPDDYGCYLVIGPAAARAVGERFLLTELDRVRLKGVSEPLAVFEPVAEFADATAAQTHYAEGYAAALEAYRARRFTEAAAGWRSLAYPGPSRTGAGGDIVDPPRVMAARAADYAERPPAEDWDGVWTRKTG
jgi:adenylate cyclase